MVSANELNFFRLTAFLVQIVPSVTGTFLETVYFGGSSFESYLNKRKHILFHLIKSKTSSYKCCACQRKPISSQCISQSQFDSLFERTGNLLHSNPCICGLQAKKCINKDILDVTLSTCILNNCESVHPTHEEHLNTIRIVRNTLFHSSSTTAITSAQFDDLWIRLQGAISGLASAVDPEYCKKIQFQIESLQRKQLFGDDEAASLLVDWITVKQTVWDIQKNTMEIEDIGKTVRRIENDTMENHLEEIRMLDAVKQNTEILLGHVSKREENPSNKNNNSNNIYIHVPMLERTFQVLYRKSQTVEELKTQIHHEEGFKECYQYLSFRSISLNDNDTLETYDINRGDTVQLKIVEPQFADMLEKTSDTDIIYVYVPEFERTFTVLYRKSQTVEDLKTQIHQKEGVKKSEQYLSFRSIHLTDGDTLESKGITRKDTVQLKIVGQSSADLLVKKYFEQKNLLKRTLGTFVPNIQPTDFSWITNEKSVLNEDFHKKIFAFQAAYSSLLFTKFKRNEYYAKLKGEDEITKQNTFIEPEVEKGKIKKLEDKVLILTEIRCFKEETGMKLQQLDDKVRELTDRVVHMDHSIEEVKTLLVQMSKGTCIYKKARQRRHQDRKPAQRFLRNRKLKTSSYKQLRQAWQSNQSDHVDSTNTKLEGDMRNAASTTSYVFIIDSNGKYIKIELHYCKTIADIKHNIQSKTRVPVGNQKLIFSGVVLDNHMSLVSYGIQSTSNLYLTFQQDDRQIPKLVLIRHVLNGFINMTEMLTHQNVIDLKLWIRQIAEVPTLRGIIMIFKGRQLYNDENIEDIGIKAKDTIHWYDFPLYKNEESYQDNSTAM